MLCSLFYHFSILRPPFFGPWTCTCFCLFSPQFLHISDHNEVIFALINMIKQFDDGLVDVSVIRILYK